MKNFFGIASIAAGSFIALARFGRLFWDYEIPTVMTAGMSGLLIFMGIVVLARNMKARQQAIE